MAEHPEQHQSREIGNLVIPFQRRKRPKERELEIIGHDTETIDGKAILIADSLGNYTYPKSFNDCINFLTRKTLRGTTGVFWNLQYDFQAIVKWLPEKLLKLLYKQQQLNFVGYKIKYIPRKLFTISKDHKSYSYYDLCQFYDSSLESASSKWLGEHKHDIDAGKVTIEDLKDPEFQKKYTLYCIHDAELCQQLGKVLLEKLNSFGLYPRNLISKASISETHFRKNCFIPTINEVPDEAIDLAYKSYRGGWFEVFQRGHIEQVYEYDLNSAYPYNIAQLADITKGEWKINSDYESKALYGYITARVRIDKSPSPIPYMHSKGYLIFPTGEFTTTVTKQEFDVIQKQLGDVLEIEKAAWFFPGELIFPFADEVQRLYQQRGTADELFSYVIKIILNSFYGKTLQKRWSSEKKKFICGNLFNPMYGSEITSRTRLQLYHSLPEYRHLISVATDSIVSSIPLSLENSKQLGGWKLALEGEGLFVGSGIYNIRTAETVKRKNRCFRAKYTLFDLFAENPELEHFTMENSRPLSLGDVMHKTLKYGTKDLNVFVPDNKTLNINFDRKRLWEDDFVNAGDMLSRKIGSKPLSISLLRDLEMIRSLRSERFERKPTHYLFELIQEAGGIRPYKNGFLREEFSEIPKRLINRKHGRYLDELAADLGYESDESLRQALLSLV